MSPHTHYPKKARAANQILLVVLAVTFVLSRAVPASADSPYDWGYTGGSDPIRSPDDQEHRSCEFGSTTLSARMSGAMTNLDGQTDMWDLFDNPCQSFTDVLWVETGLNGAAGAYGYTECLTHSAWGVCDQFAIYVDPALHYFQALDSCGARYASGTPAYNSCVAWEYDVNLELTFRHELGHSAGLHHYYNYVWMPPFWVYNDYSQLPMLTSSWRTMVSAWVPYGAGHTKANFTAYNSTHVGLINANVP